MDYEFVLYDAIGFKNEARGLMSTDGGDMFVEINMGGKYCSFHDEHLCCLYQFMNISGKRMHLFVG